MALIEAEKRGKEKRFEVSLDPETDDKLQAYCRYSGNRGEAGRRHVVRGALRVLFEADKEFEPWLKQQAELPPPPPAPRRKRPAAPTVELLPAGSAVTSGGGNGKEAKATA